jgi:hypothetical protein
MDDKATEHERVLDRIIEKYTATPRDDPDRINYYMRPVRKERRRRLPERRTATASNARNARR